MFSIAQWKFPHGSEGQKNKWSLKLPRQIYNLSYPGCSDLKSDSLSPMNPSITERRPMDRELGRHVQHSEKNTGLT